MKPSVIALVAGLLFGLGLAISDMLNPARVLAFLDVFGLWDPTLAFVMGGALLITVPGFAWVLKRRQPICEAGFDLPTNQSITSSLISGAVLFGIGWGLVGLCPGPALAALVTLEPALLVFVVVMLGSWWLTDQLIAKLGTAS